MRGRVTDRGPQAGLAEGEEGHQEGCARRAKELAGWEAAWDDAGAADRDSDGYRTAGEDPRWAGDA